jgi:hypothetical protein
MLQAKPQQSKIWLGLAAAALGSFAVAGCGGSGDGGAGGAPQVGMSGGTGGSGSTAGGPGAGMQAMGGSGGGPGSGGGMTAAGGGFGGQGQAGLPAAGTPGQKTAQNGKPGGIQGSAPGFRKDPFAPWFSTVPPPPNVLTLTEPVRIAMAGTTAPEVQPGVEIQEVPSRRVAGILNGNGVYALLDGGPSGPEVVKPGQLLDDGYRVMMINSTSVTLQKKVATQTYTQVVPLTDAGGPPPSSVGGGGMNPGGMSPGGIGSGFGPGGRRRGGGPSGIPGAGLPGAGGLAPGG